MDAFQNLEEEIITLRKKIEKLTNISIKFSQSLEQLD